MGSGNGSVPEGMLPVVGHFADRLVDRVELRPPACPVRCACGLLGPVFASYHAEPPAYPAAHSVEEEQIASLSLATSHVSELADAGGSQLYADLAKIALTGAMFRKQWRNSCAIKG